MKSRRFGSFHRYHQPPLSRMFPPEERDALLLAAAGDKSVVNGDKTVESEKSGVKDEESGEMRGKLLTQKREDFHRGLWKSLWKRAVLMLQVPEFFRLLAFCTRS